MSRTYRYISAVQEKLKILCLVLIIPDTIDLYGRIGSTCTYFCTILLAVHACVHSARDLLIQKYIYTIPVAPVAQR